MMQKNEIAKFFVSPSIVSPRCASRTVFNGLKESTCNKLPGIAS